MHKCMPFRKKPMNIYFTLCEKKGRQKKWVLVSHTRNGGTLYHGTVFTKMTGACWTGVCKTKIKY